MSRAVLDELAVTNLALIAAARVEPKVGLVVITGETGTGKTLLLGALRLLRGETASRDMIGPDGDEVTIEGRFIVDGEEMVLGRRVAAGRSRAYRDNRMAPARALAEATAGLIEIVGQNDHLALLERAGTRSLVDAALGGDGVAVLERYREAWADLRRLEKLGDLLGGDRRSLERERDMASWQATEIEEAAFSPGDEVDLVARAVRLRNHESIGERLGAVLAAAGEEGAISDLAAAGRQLEGAARLDPSLEPLVAQLGEVASLLGELVADVTAVAVDIERDPTALEEVEARLALLFDLRRKYGDDLAAVIDFGARAAARAAELDELLVDADRIAAEIEAARVVVTSVGVELSEARRLAAERLAQSATAHLAEMGLASPIVRFAFASSPLSAWGSDVVTLEFASDEAMTPGPAARIASGGELSRLVLALRLASGVADAPLIAFDEVDAGVGGATALAVGAKLAALAEGRQVLCVTHLPQVAAFAGTHLVVTRDGPVAAVAEVDGEARVRELTRMLSGLPESAQGRAHATELLSLAGATSA